MPQMMRLDALNATPTTQATDQATDNRQQTTDIKQQTTDNSQQTTDSRQQTKDNRCQQTQIIDVTMWNVECVIRNIHLIVCLIFLRT